MKGNISKGQVGLVRDTLAELGSDAQVVHAEQGGGWEVVTKGMSAAERRRVVERLRALGIENPMDSDQ